MVIEVSQGRCQCDNSRNMDSGPANHAMYFCLWALFMLNINALFPFCNVLLLVYPDFMTWWVWQYPAHNKQCWQHTHLMGVPWVGAHFRVRYQTRDSFWVEYHYFYFCFVLFLFWNGVWVSCLAGVQWCNLCSLQPLPPEFKWFSCLSLSRITGACHHAWLIFVFFSRDEILLCWPGWSRSLDLVIHLPRPSKVMGLQAWATAHSLFILFYK